MFQKPPVHNAATVMAIVLIGSSALVAIVKPLALYVYLVPELLISKLFLWQLFTYAFIEATPLAVIFGGFIVWSLGGGLEAIWGRKRFLRFTLSVVVSAAIATVALSFLTPSLVARAYPGGNVLTAVLWVAYGLHLAHRHINFWGFSLRGNTLAMLGVGFVLLNAAFIGFRTVIPEMWALLFTWLFLRKGRPDEWLTIIRSRLTGKQRSRHLKGLQNNSDKYLH